MKQKPFKKRCDDCSRGMVSRPNCRKSGYQHTYVYRTFKLGPFFWTWTSQVDVILTIIERPNVLSIGRPKTNVKWTSENEHHFGPYNFGENIGENNHSLRDQNPSSLEPQPNACPIHQSLVMNVRLFYVVIEVNYNIISS